MVDVARLMVDGNEAAARVAFQLSEVIAIYPITPASPMGELADAWSAAGRPNLWGDVPTVIEMQSEAGAAGTLHGALQSGALSTTFTASQGLLLMIPNMYKIAGELTPTVIHVAARAIATHALSIFGDHSDVMAARATGFAMLASSDVQECQDLALVAHAATLKSRVPFLHFFDGFRTSHEVNGIETIDPSVAARLIPDSLVAAHRSRALDPNRPAVRGTSQNPDVFFQAREAANPFYLDLPGIVSDVMDDFGDATGRRYRLFDYFGSADADTVLVLMGSGVGAARQAVEHLLEKGEKVGVVAVRLYRPFAVEALLAALPAEVQNVAVLDRCKEPGAVGEPLLQDVVMALARSDRPMPRVIGGRYGLGSKEFTPAMVLAVFEEARRSEPRRQFTVGINDDVTKLSLPVDEERWEEPADVYRAVFYGLGSDGTVSANKQTVKIIGDHTGQYAQGYFVYDSKKSGSTTVSHLRFSPRPISSTYLIRRAQFAACHQWQLLDRLDVLEVAARGATLLINAPFAPDQLWDRLPKRVQQEIVARDISLYTVDAATIARRAGLGGRINTVMQACFFALSELMPIAEALEAIKSGIASAYGRRGEAVLRRNYQAVDEALINLTRVEMGAVDPHAAPPAPLIPASAPNFVQTVIAPLLAGKGDLLPVSAFPVDGTFPTGTARWEKRSLADEIPIWDPSICIDCGRCALVCPHAAIRMKVFPRSLTGLPAELKTKEYSGKELPDHLLTIQVAPDDCTGCGVCVDICPAKSKAEVKHKSINMERKLDHLATEQVAFEAFLAIPDPDRRLIRVDTVKGSQMIDPLFEFSGACEGCGETPYVKLITQMFGDRLVIANATGCSSIYGGNLPTTPWATDAAGRGPAWSNSLFEDNAEFGLGLRLGADARRSAATRLLAEAGNRIGSLGAELIGATQTTEEEVAAQRLRVSELKSRLESDAGAGPLLGLADNLVRTTVWIVGGDGWAYDIGFGGVDHVLASGQDVNILVLDTEVYSNTGGQASKATPRGAVAKFSSGGKATAKKDLGMIAMAYGNVYVAQIAMGANMTQTVKALAEADAHPGPSLVIAYSPCIAHGIDMATQMTHQKEAADSGYWPLYRYNPAAEAVGTAALKLDSRPPSIPFKTFAEKEARFSMLELTAPDHARTLLDAAQRDIDDRWHLYEQMVNVHRTATFEEHE